MSEANEVPEPQQLGELEATVMDIVWRMGEATVQDVKDALEPERELAYTTVMTVMSRLADKQLLDRHREGRAYVYRPATTRERLAGSLLNALVRRLYAGATGTAIAHLLETEESVDEEELKRLEDLIRAKRQERK